MEKSIIIKEFLQATVQKFPECVAYGTIHADKTISTVSYEELNADIEALGTALISLGLKDKHIAVIGENRYEWCLSFFSLVCGVGVSVNLDKELTTDELIKLTSKGDVEAIIYSSIVSSKIEQVLAVNKNIVPICMDEKDELTNLTIKDLVAMGKTLVQSGNTDFTSIQPAADEMAILLFTSGTSSEAKGVGMTNRNVSSVVHIATGVISLNEKDSLLSYLPINHIYECVLGVLMPASVGAAVIFSRGLRTLLADLKIAKPTIVLGVPLILETMYKQICLKINGGKHGKLKIKAAITTNTILKTIGLDRSREFFAQIHDIFGGRVRVVTSAAAKLNPAAHKFFRQVGIQVLCAYGMSETASGISCEFIEKYKVGSCGKLIDCMEIKIDKPDSGGIGEILLKGDNVATSYYKDPIATEQSFKDGWFYTGDLGYVDKENWVYITGRTKNIIVLKNGKKLSPEEMEDKILDLPYVKEGMVAGVPDPEKDYDDVVITAFIYPDYELLQSEKGLEKTQTEEIQQLLQSEIDEVNQQLTMYKRISKIIVRQEEFEKTTTKKIMRRKVLGQ